MNLRSLIYTLYPCVIAIHDLSDDVAFPDPVTGRIEIPSAMRASHIYMEGHGLYLMGISFSLFSGYYTNDADNEEMVIIWIGVGVSPKLLGDLFGVDDFMKVDPLLVSPIPTSGMYILNLHF